MDIDALKDYKLADEIQRIESLSRDKLVSELVQLVSEKIDSLSDEELLLGK